VKEDDFYKFPSTPHLALLGDIIVRGDKIMSQSERDEFLQHDLVIEEKIDGSNLGISFDKFGNVMAQNRGAYLHLPSSGQWKKLTEWLSLKADYLFDLLGDRYILFGEWCYAKHSVKYDKLPDWFIGFDIFDKSKLKFISSSKRNVLLRDSQIITVPMIKNGKFSLDQVQKLLANSCFSDGPAEGLYLRYDSEEWLIQRAKLVRPTFVQSISQHWSRSNIQVNRIK